MIAEAIEICRLPIHLRFIFCNLNDESIELLANSLVKNSSLIGFSALFNFTTTSPAKLSLENALIRTPAPLQIWKHAKLPDYIIVVRKKVKLRTFLCSLPFTGGPAKILPVEIIQKILVWIEG